MASKNMLRMRADQAKLQRSHVPVKGTEVLPVWRKRKVWRRGILGVPKQHEERVLVGGRRTGEPYVNPEKDRSLRGKARVKARKAARRARRAQNGRK
jgi:hypothetical protein